MEDDLKAIVVGIAEDIPIKLQRLLLVAAEEVHLDGFHTDALHPCHIALAANRIVHHVARALRRIVCRAVAVIP